MKRFKRYGRALGWRIARAINRAAGSSYSLVFRPDSHTAFDTVSGYDELYRKWTFGNERNNSGDLSRFYTIYQNVSHIFEENVPGDIVELGVFKGNSAAVLAYLGRKHGRTTYLFDTFSGFDARDLKGADHGRHVEFADTTMEAVKALVGGDRVVYVKGFFPESAAQIAMPETIAVAHIDCDLRAPMSAGLEMFYPRLAPQNPLVENDCGVLAVGHAELLRPLQSGERDLARRRLPRLRVRLPPAIVLPGDDAQLLVERRTAIVADRR
jgi:hypothetical protein